MSKPRKPYLSARVIEGLVSIAARAEIQTPEELVARSWIIATARQKISRTEAKHEAVQGKRSGGGCAPHLG